MHEWIIMAVVVAASLAVIAMMITRRRRTVASPAPTRAAPVPVGVTGRAPKPERIVVEPPAAPTPSFEAEPVPNTTVPPHPDDLPLATLEFGGPPGKVEVRRGTIVIGRHSEDDIRLSDVRVSRRHARLVAAPGGRIEIENLTTERRQPNPVLVNGVERAHAVIRDGDVVTLGGVSFRLSLARRAERPAHQEI